MARLTAPETHGPDPRSYTYRLCDDGAAGRLQILEFRVRVGAVVRMVDGAVVQATPINNAGVWLIQPLADLVRECAAATNDRFHGAPVR
ncbi:hypothetical protein GCM10009661_49980 [Catellatospora chokoriensis]|uniref:Uncharacterized protein n=1 Tax=Catellatospora chokoriensis TaxID=310353 RepID=A0A8J3K4E4_9ACTN|nr:hypothetical protein Cch02nite_73280 [Catellatospora chokoriensis]